MQNAWKAAPPLATAAVILGILWTVNSCWERGQQFKIECMRAGGSVVSTPQQDLCLQGLAAQRSKP